VAGRIKSTEKSDYLIGNRTRDLPACRIVCLSQLRYHAPPLEMNIHENISVIMSGVRIERKKLFPCLSFREAVSAAFTSLPKFATASLQASPYTLSNATA
jgi:hypothetical protein